MISEMSAHDQLIEYAARWLRAQGYPIVITEMVSGRETPDAWGCRPTTSCLIECKARRADFLRDRRKWTRRRPESGIGRLRYYCSPEDIIRAGDLPDKWGLLWVVRRGLRVVRFASYQQPDLMQEMRLLMSALRRIGRVARIGTGDQAPIPGISVKAYTMQTKSRATLGICPEVIDGKEDQKETR